jgi:hypothetical protein
MKRSCVLAALLAALLAPAGAGARGTKADPAALLEKGISQFEAGELRAAEKTLQDAVAASSGPAAARAHLYRGMVLLTLGRQAEGERALTEALRADPLVAPDESRIKTALVERCRADRARLRGVRVARADRPGALILVDGERAGGATLTRALSVGRHRVEAASPDGAWRAGAREIVVPVDGKVRVALQLEPVQGTLRLTSTPEGAGVEIDRAHAGRTPLALLVAVGAREVVVRHQGLEWRETVEIREGRETVRHAALGPSSLVPSPTPTPAPRSSSTHAAAVEPPPTGPPGHWSRPAGVALLAVGAAGAVGGGAFALLGKGVDDQIRAGGLATPQEILDAESRGQGYNQAALGCAVAAGLGLGAGALLLLLGDETPPPLAVSGSIGGPGAALVVTGRLP